MRRFALRRDEGQILPLLLLGLLVVMLGVTGLVIDLGKAYVVKRQLQATADAAALAAAGDLPDTGAAVAAATAYGPAGKNPVAGASVTQTATPWCLKSLDYCYGSSPGGAPQSSRANGLVVQERTSVPTTFARLFGVDSIDVGAKATACGMCGSQPLDIALVVDRTESMADNMDDLRNGIKAFLEALDPRLDYVTLMVLPPLTGGACSGGWFSSTYPFQPYYPYPSGSDGSYTVVRLAHDYQNDDGSLDDGSPLVSDVDCMQPTGSTSYTQALVAAQNELMEHGSGREGVQRVIVFESDGAANTAPESSYDTSAPSATIGGGGGGYGGYGGGGTDVYQPSSAGEPQVLRPCGSAVDYANDVIKPSGTLVYTVAYAVNHNDGCYQAPHAEQDGWDWHRGRRVPQMEAVGFQDEREADGLSAPDALAQIASPDDAVSQEDAGDMTDSFQQIAGKLLGATLVPDSEGT